MKRWRVERSGTATGGYGRGWFASYGIDYHDAVGSWFPTWQQALNFTNSEIARQIVRSHA